MHDWNQHQYVSDGSTERVRKHREKQRKDVSRNVTVTPQIQNRTDTEQNRTETEPETRAEVRQIRSPEPSVKPGGISLATWDAFRNRFSESGKPLNDADWGKAAQEAVTLDLSESDMTERVIPCLTSELPGWADRDIGMVPYPANWLKGQPWTRTAKPRDPPLTREQRKQREIDDSWGGVPTRRQAEINRQWEEIGGSPASRSGG